MAASASNSATVYSAKDSTYGYTLAVSFTETAVSGGGDNYSTISVTGTLSSTKIAWASINCTMTLYWHDNHENKDVNLGSQTFSQGGKTTYADYGTPSLTKTYTAYHNSDGKLNGYAFVAWTGSSNSYAPKSASVYTSNTALTTIARYFSSTPTLTFVSKEEEKIIYNWSTSETCSAITWSGGGKCVTTGVPGTSGTLTITELAANTSYTHKGTFKRSDSGLTTDSSGKTNTTYAYPYIKTVGVSELTIGNEQTLTIYNPLQRTIELYMYKGTTHTSSDTALWSKLDFNVKGDSAECKFTPNATTLYSTIPANRDSKCHYRIKFGTKVDSNTTGTYSYVCNEASCRPVINADKITFKDNNTTTTSITGQTAAGGWLVQGKSTLRVTLDSGVVTLKNNVDTSTVTYSVSVPSAETKTRTSVGSVDFANLSLVGDQTITITVTDAREYSATVTKTVTYEPYYTPSITASATRTDSYSTNANITGSVNIASLKGTNKTNAYAVFTDSTKTSRTVWLLGTSTSTLVAPAALSGSLTNVDTAAPTTITFYVRDSFSTTYQNTTFTIPASAPIAFIDSNTEGVGVGCFPSAKGLFINGVEQHPGGSVGPTTDVTQPWYRIASISLTGASVDAGITFKVNQVHKSYSTRAGILTCHVATNSSKQWSSGELVWEYANSGITPANFVLLHNTEATPVVAEIWVKQTDSYAHYHFSVLSTGDRYYRYNAAWQLEDHIRTTGSTNYTADLIAIESTLATLKNNVNVDLIYPIGSIYMSTSETNPKDLFGGTWSRIKDRFLVAVGDTNFTTVTGTGGAMTVKLETTNLPSHNHSFTGTAVTSGGASTTKTSESGSHTHGYKVAKSWAFKIGTSTQNTVSDEPTSSTMTYGWTTDSAGAHTHTLAHTHSVTASGTIGNTGSGTAFSIVPPYYAVYMWRRTA